MTVATTVVLDGIGTQLFHAANPSGAPRLHSRDLFGVFGETRRSVSFFAKASEDTRYAFLRGVTVVASCAGG